MLAFLAHNNLNNLNLYLGGGFYPAKMWEHAIQSDA